MLEITVRGAKMGPVMEVFLIQGKNEVAVKARDDSGEVWNLLWIMLDGLVMAQGITSSTGWPLDSDGRLIVVNPKAE